MKKYVQAFVTWFICFTFVFSIITISSSEIGYIYPIANSNESLDGNSFVTDNYAIWMHVVGDGTRSFKKKDLTTNSISTILTTEQFYHTNSSNSLYASNEYFTFLNYIDYYQGDVKPMCVELSSGQIYSMGTAQQTYSSYINVFGKYAVYPMSSKTDSIGGLYMFNMESKNMIQICSYDPFEMPSSMATISDNVIAYIGDNNTTGREIYIYDIITSETKRISSTSGLVSQPNIQKNYVYYLDNSAGVNSIMCYSIASKITTIVLSSTDNNFTLKNNPFGDYLIYIEAVNSVSGSSSMLKAYDPITGSTYTIDSCTQGTTGYFVAGGSCYDDWFVYTDFGYHPSLNSTGEIMPMIPNDHHDSTTTALVAVKLSPSFTTYPIILPGVRPVLFYDVRIYNKNATWYEWDELTGDYNVYGFKFN